MSQVTQVIQLTGGIAGEPVVRENKAAGTITPGDLIERITAGTVQRHGTAAVNSNKAFALPNIADGGTIDDDYTTGESVRYGLFHTGQEVNALVAAGAPAIVIGDELESAGDGTLRKALADAATDTVQRDSIIAYAEVAVDNSGGGSIVRIQASIA